MAPIHGKDIRIYNSGGTALIAGAKSCSIEKECESFEVASESDGDNTHVIPGRKSWSIDINHLITTDGVTLDEGSYYSIQVVIGSGVTWVGQALCKKCNIQGATGNLATGSIKLIGNGPLGPASS